MTQNAYVTVTNWGATNTTICAACGVRDRHAKCVDAQHAATQHDIDHHNGTEPHA